jgi:CBS domain-containing protein
MITIDELMTADPHTLTENDTIQDARAIMTEKHIRHIPITDNDMHVLGLVTQRDVLQATDPKSEEQDSVRLSEIMIRNVKVIHQSDSVRQAAIYLRSHKYGCLPVVSEGALVGIITDSDFIEIAINLLEQLEIAEELPDMEPEDMDDFEMPVPEDYS